MKLILDIETNLQHDRIFLVVTKNLDTGELLCHTESSSLKPLIDAAEQIIGHNAINFDLHLLQKLWKIPISWKMCFDTLIVSRLVRPDLEGGHSLGNWGKILKFPKGDFTDFDAGLTQEMITYCKQDVELTHKVYNSLVKSLKEHKFSEVSVELEHWVAYIVGEQERNGFKLSLVDTLHLLSTLKEKKDAIEEWALTLPGKVIQLKTKVKVVPFNPGSRQQIADYLKTLGWKPKRFTETGKPVVDEKSLLGFDHPAAKKFEEFFLLQKRVALIDSWLEAADKEGVVHGKVITNGAITGRMTHYSPNMAQVPAVGSPYGAECRSCFISKQGKVLVGIDASGLELRMLAHHMGDDEYVKAVTHGSQEHGTDVHSVNQRAANLETRAQAKTFIYAFLYGAGPSKIGAIVGGSAADGEKLIASFLGATPALQDLRTRVAKESAGGKLIALDGRVLWVRSQHSALNTLLQGNGAVVMKQALCFFKQALDENGYNYGFCANVHDEWQVECLPEDAEHVGQLGVMAIEAAGRHFNLKCPLTGEYKIGRNWKETH